MKFIRLKVKVATQYSRVFIGEYPVMLCKLIMSTYLGFNNDVLPYD